MKTKNKNYKTNKITRLSPEIRDIARAKRERGIYDHSIKRMPKDMRTLVINFDSETLQTLTSMGTDEAIRAMEKRAQIERDRVMEEMITQGWWDE